LRYNKEVGEIHLQDQTDIRKRTLIESVNDELKNISQIEHAIHRTFTNFISNFITGFITYIFLQKNPFIQVERIDPFTARFILNHYIELTLC